MKLLVCLAERAGEVVSIDDLLDQVWSGVVVTPDSVYQAVASLRRLLGDDARQPEYIATVPRLGYRMVASVSPWVDEPRVEPPVVPADPAGSPRGQRRKGVVLLAGGVALFVALMAALLFNSRLVSFTRSFAPGAIPQKSVAVLAAGAHRGGAADESRWSCDRGEVCRSAALPRSDDTSDE